MLSSRMVVSSAVNERAAAVASASRVNSSTTLQNRICRPSLVTSTWKSTRPHFVWAGGGQPVTPLRTDPLPLADPGRPGEPFVGPVAADPLAVDHQAVAA